MCIKTAYFMQILLYIMLWMLLDERLRDYMRGSEPNSVSDSFVNPLALPQSDEGSYRWLRATPVTVIANVLKLPQPCTKPLIYQKLWPMCVGRFPVCGWFGAVCEWCDWHVSYAGAANALDAWMELQRLQLRMDWDWNHWKAPSKEYSW